MFCTKLRTPLIALCYCCQVSDHSDVLFLISSTIPGQDGFYQVCILLHIPRIYPKQTCICTPSGYPLKDHPSIGRGCWAKQLQKKRLKQQQHSIIINFCLSQSQFHTRFLVICCACSLPLVEFLRPSSSNAVSLDIDRPLICG